MTMQGISNVLPKTAAAVAEKCEKVTGTLFEAVMSSQGNKQQTRKSEMVNASRLIKILPKGCWTRSA